MARQALNSLEEKVDPRIAALLVIDMQNEFVSTGGAWERSGEDISLPQKALSNIINLIARGREQRLPIVFIKSIYNTDDNRYLSDVFLQQMRRRAKGRYFEFPVCVPDSWGSDLAPGLEVRPEDTVVIKHRFNAFFNTDLELTLRSRGIRTLLISGVGTAVCVESTTRDAYFRDFYNVIVEDCCGAYSREVHEQALRRMDLQYGEVAQSDKVIAAWQAIRTRTPL
jgi:ureidoacrylate peracid hydrolase